MRSEYFRSGKAGRRRSIMMNTANNTYEATAMNSKSELMVKLDRVKKGLAIAAVSQLLWVIVFVFKQLPTTVSDVLCIIAIVTEVAAYFISGGVAAAFKTTWKVSKAIGKFGWAIAPFPVDIFTGLFLTFCGIIMFPTIMVLLPLVLVFANFCEINKRIKEQEAA